MHSRRDFVRGSLAAAGGAAVAGAHVSTAESSSFSGAVADSIPMRVSIMAYSFHGLLRQGKIDIFGLLETFKYRYHLRAADLWNFFLKSTEEDYLKKIRDGLDERGLVVPNLACDWCTVWVDDPALRQKNYQRALAHLNAGKILGARFVRIDAGGPPVTDQRREWTDEEFDHIVKRYREYAQYAHDNGFKAGAESHWGPEAWWPSMEKLCKAVDHPGFAICCHISGWKGTKEEKDRGDRECVPWAAHTHIPWNITEGPLVEKMNNLRDGGYQGYYSVEHHTGKMEYAEVAIQLSKVRTVLESWRTGAKSSLPTA
jgi:sugar phosphate isomerase/epimerase